MKLTSQDQGENMGIKQQKPNYLHFNVDTVRLITNQARKPNIRAARYFWEIAKPQIIEAAQRGDSSVNIQYNGKATIEDIKRYSTAKGLGFICIASFYLSRYGESPAVEVSW